MHSRVWKMRGLGFPIRLCFLLRVLWFLFSGVSFFQNVSLVEVLVLNGYVFNVEKLAYWNAEENGYFYQLFMELWIYNVESGSLRFHNRFVSIWLNMTGT
jgi:hypothetical protein